jgi:hypothetical protein
VTGEQTIEGARSAPANREFVGIQSESGVMRFVLGIVVGIILTIGFAYLSDASISPSTNASGQTALEQRPMVNWDVVNRDWQNFTSGVRNAWHKLAQR